MSPPLLSTIPEVAVTGWSGRRPARTRILSPTGAQVPTVAAAEESPWIPRGGGNSFGDCAYVSGGVTLSSQRLDRILEVDASRGLVLGEAGVTNGALFRLLEGPDLRHWTLPVAGGTGRVTLGGAVAGDIHGKDHPSRGSYGNHVTGLLVATASGQEVWCSPELHPDLFQATIGGMGLTGFIRQVRLQLVPAPGGRAGQVRAMTRPIPDVRAQGLRIFEEEPADLKMAWIDLASARPRGILHYARFTELPPRPARRRLNLPIPRLAMLNPWTAPLVNRAIYRAHRNLDRVIRLVEAHYPLDSIPGFQRAYGPRGFVEYQFVVPRERGQEGLEALLEASRQTPAFHTVLKRFGSRPPAGLLSFAREGFTFTTLFAVTPTVHPVLEGLTQRVSGLGGGLNLTKDSCLSGRQFQDLQPNLPAWRRIARQWDPQGRIQSDLSLRLGLKPW